MYQRGDIVSIHAPAKGATISRSRNDVGDSFNPRSREGSDPWRRGLQKYYLCFNPRSREGSDEYDIWAEVRPRVVSIHAPAKGATSVLSSTIFCTLFQSTLPRRERRPVSPFTKYASGFNPRSREGSDGGDSGGKSYYYEVSIHAPAKGATPPQVLRIMQRQAFQSTLPRRERRTIHTLSQNHS